MNSIHKEMGKQYWDGMARSYEEEIFSVLHSDKKGLIKRQLRKIGASQKSVADVGCGIGHFLPTLAEIFGQVYANDISGELLARAEKSCGKISNISFLKGDIRSAFKKLPPVDCAVSVNSLISSSAGIRHKMLMAIAGIINTGGYFILVVPSLESALFVDVKFAQWKWQGGMDPARAIRSVYPKFPNADNKARQGILPIDGVDTKHFLAEEVRLLLGEVGLNVLETVKIEYGWGTEFENPPDWMGEPYPWDWLVVAQKQKR